VRFMTFKADRDAAGFVSPVHLEEIRLDMHRLEAVDRLAAKIVGADATEDCCMITPTPRHDGEVRRRAAEAHAVRQDIPEQFANAENQMRLAHGRTQR
jgi:hypothetical protein